MLFINAEYLWFPKGMFDFCNRTFPERAGYSTLLRDKNETLYCKREFLYFVKIQIVNNSVRKYIHIYCAKIVEIFLAYFTKMYYLCIEFE